MVKMGRLLANPNESLRQKISSRQMFLQKEHSNHYVPKQNQVWKSLNLPALESQVAPAYRLEPLRAPTLPGHCPKWGKQGISGLFPKHLGT